MTKRHSSRMKREGASSKGPSDPRGVIRGVWAFTKQMIVYVFLSWICLVIGFLVYQNIHGEVARDNQMNRILESTIQSLTENNNPIAEDGYAAFEQGKKKMLHFLLVKAYIQNILLWSEQKVRDAKAISHQRIELRNNDRSIKFLGLFSQWIQTFWPSVLTLILGVTVITLSKACVFILAMPLFVIFIAIAFVDALVKRDVRKYQGARESTYFFHRIKKVWKLCYFTPFFIYFIWPWPAEPAWFLMPMAVWVAMMIHVSFRLFKKYV